MPHRSTRPGLRLAWSQSTAVAALALLVALASLARMPAAEPTATGPAVTGPATMGFASDAPIRAGGAERSAGGDVALDAGAGAAQPAHATSALVHGDAAAAGHLVGMVAPDWQAGETRAPADTGREGSADVPPVQFLTVGTGAGARRLPFVDLSPPIVNGRTALLLGGDDGGAPWAATADRLAAAGYRVIVPDFRPVPVAGIGVAGGTPPRRSVAALAADAAILLDSLGAPEATVVGHGSGAEAAVRLARETRRVTGLALVGAGASPDLAGLALPTVVLTGTPGDPSDAAALEAALLHFLAR